MGLNFYAEINKCKHCGSPEEKIHIGKSSFGWKFAIEMNEEYYKTFDEFLEFIDKKEVNIVDEYGNKISSKHLQKKMESNCEGKSHFDDYPEDKYADCTIADLHMGGFT